MIDKKHFDERERSEIIDVSVSAKSVSVARRCLDFSRSIGRRFESPSFNSPKRGDGRKLFSK